MKRLVLLLMLISNISFSQVLKVGGFGNNSGVFNYIIDVSYKIGEGDTQLTMKRYMIEEAEQTARQRAGVFVQSQLGMVANNDGLYSQLITKQVGASITKTNLSDFKISNNGETATATVLVSTDTAQLMKDIKLNILAASEPQSLVSKPDSAETLVHNKQLEYKKQVIAEMEQAKANKLKAEPISLIFSSILSKHAIIKSEFIQESVTENKYYKETNKTPYTIDGYVLTTVEIPEQAAIELSKVTSIQSGYVKTTKDEVTEKAQRIVGGVLTLGLTELMMGMNDVNERTHRSYCDITTTNVKYRKHLYVIDKRIIPYIIVRSHYIDWSGRKTFVDDKVSLRRFYGWNDEFGITSTITIKRTVHDTSLVKNYYSEVVGFGANWEDVDNIKGDCLSPREF